MAETLVAIFLLALLIITVFNLFPTTVLANRQGSERLQALTVAQSVLAEVRARPFDELAPGLMETLPDRQAGGVRYRPQVRVESPERGDPDRLRILEVSVSWETQTGKRSLTERLWVHRVVEERT